ncbi:hypothetical protein [Pedobacter sandarakinus]|uniref:hypothetical protein n=1 Tax=Pedobacter sandarakinus TaxID=353156 RepID=UPI0022470004|nr:hypothetical protein [Pedobacter sandarakinus]MCX2573581.1 hypothetical protein [Pedobacter sandarakinus]
MKAKEFVEKILGLRPIHSDFSNTDFSIDLIEDWIKQFEIKKKANNNNPNEIMNLLLNYDVAELRINDITFDSDYQEDDQYIFLDGMYYQIELPLLAQALV